jgi:hypothetical protein
VSLFILLFLFFVLLYLPKLGNPVYLGTIAGIYVSNPADNPPHLIQHVAVSTIHLLFSIERRVRFVCKSFELKVFIERFFVFTG